MCKIRLSLPLIFGLMATLFIAQPAFAAVTLLTDGFESNFDKWTDGGTTNWDRTTSQKHSGSYSAHAGSRDDDLISDNLNTSGYSSITITFWYRDDDIDDGDNIYLQLYNGTSYANKFELGNSTEDTWHQYQVTINNSGADAQYFISNFRIKFEGSSIDSRENLWIDDVTVTVSDIFPAAPTGLTGTAVSSSQINLSWTDNSTDETGFKIERKTGAGGTYAQIDTVGADITTYQNTGLSASTEYYYRVRAYNTGGDSGYSNEANATTTLPGKFWEWECNVNPTTLDGNGDTIGDWVVRGQSPGTGFSGNLTTDGGLTVYTGGDLLDARPLYDATDADLAAEIEWKSLNDDTVNNWNSVLWWNLDYTGGQMGRPWCWVNRSGGNTVIHMQEVTGGSSSDITVNGIGYFTMRWQINTVTDTLAVYINGEGSPRETYNYTLADEAVTDKFPTLQLGNGRGYIDYVHIYAGDYAIMPPPTAPSAPSGLGATTISSSQINLSWTDNSNNEDGFKIERKTGAGGTYAQIDTVGAGVTTYQNSGLTDATNYYYRVRAYNTGGDSEYSNEANATTLPTAPSAPSGLGATAVSSTQINLSWTDTSNNEDGFKIERKTGAGGTYAQIDTVGAGITTYQNTGLSASTEYYYRVRAYNTGGDSGYSNEANATTTDAGTTVGTILREWWTGISGTAVSDLTSNANYPDNPTGTEEITSFEGPTDWADNYGTRIYGYLHPSANGDYTFWIASDDNSELWLSTDDNPANASLIANVPEWTSSRQWTKYAEQQSSVISLTGGQKYYIEALQKEEGGGDNVAVAWEGPDISQEVIDGSHLSPWWTGIGTGKGLIGNYYDNTDFTNPKVSRLDPTVNFDWGNGSPDPLIGVDTFSVRWAGQIQPLYSETYTFYTTTDDGVRLWVNNQLLIDKWIDQGPTEWSGTIALTAEVKYDTKMEYYENGGGAVAQLSWSSPTQPKEIIPQSQLYSSEGPPSYDWAVDGERILNLDGTINWGEYDYVANNIDQVWVRDYFFGPHYSYYHPTPESLPTLPQRGVDGWDGTVCGTSGCYPPQPHHDWYAQAGQLLYMADVADDYGAANASNGDMWCVDGADPPWCFDYRLEYEPPYHYRNNPTPELETWGNPQTKPTAVARPRGITGVTGFMAFKNGLVGTVSNRMNEYEQFPPETRYPIVTLDAGKVPMAMCTTLASEFILVAVWDTVEHKGQVAVIAVKGRICAQEGAEEAKYLYGFPHWPNITGLKLLGYIDLPFDAPMSISESSDPGMRMNGRGDTTNVGFDLNSQAERDTWYDWSGHHYKRTARAGYTVVSSRAENKVAFIDMAPLYQYYRTMYFTTQANYDETKTGDWPYTFGQVPAQMPVVTQTLDITQPTAVTAGFAKGMTRVGWGWRDPDIMKDYTYVTTMDGNLHMYTGQSNPSFYQTVAIGKNPTWIDCGFAAWKQNDLIITCRGDRKIQFVHADGTILAEMRDSRIQDPVMAEGSKNGRYCETKTFVHVMDFWGKKVFTHVHDGEDFATGFDFCAEKDTPGSPFVFEQDEVL